MEETYLKLLNESSFLFLQKAREIESKPEKKYFLLSSIILSWLFLEAYINYLSNILSNGKCNEYEKSILLDNELILNDDGNIIESSSHMPVLKRALFVMQKFSKIDTKKFRQTTLWAEVKTCEKLRNELLHPKQNILPEYIDLSKAEKYRKIVNSFVEKLNRAVMKSKIIIY